MTDAEKTRHAEFVEVRIKLEEHFRTTTASRQTIQTVRIDAYLEVAKLMSD